MEHLHDLIGFFNIDNLAIFDYLYRMVIGATIASSHSRHGVLGIGLPSGYD